LPVCCAACARDGRSLQAVFQAIWSCSATRLSTSGDWPMPESRLVSMIKTEFCLFEMEVEGVSGHSAELCQASFCEAPEALNALMWLPWRANSLSRCSTGSACRNPGRLIRCSLPRSNTKIASPLKWTKPRWASGVIRVPGPRSIVDVWGEIRELLGGNAGLAANAILEYLQRNNPGRFQDGQLRALQWKVKNWRRPGTLPTPTARSATPSLRLSKLSREAA